jgi:outer membrane protein OmpA-like peptidoglycan-associated protein
MKRLAPIALALGLGLTAWTASAQEDRFDVQSFRPFAGPQDLVLVGQSRLLAPFSPVGGAYLNFSLDPLVLITAGTNSKAVSVVGNRLQLDVMAAVAIAPIASEVGWVELGVTMPLVLAQASDNLEAIGTEGYLQSFVPGDMRLTGKVPLWRRAPEGSGLGAAAILGVSLPTGIREAFASDGALTWNPNVIADYRFGSGLLLSLNAGLWLRPDHEFLGVKWGSSATFGLATEVPILRGMGINAVGMFSGSTPLEKFPNQPQQLPAELLMGLRWYSDADLTFTVGGGGGCGCSLTAPTLRFFSSVVWNPFGGEKDNIKKFKNPPPPPVDPDYDSVIGQGDRCPNEAGPVENGGCPDTDLDKDGLVDRLDTCPAEAGLKAKQGCPNRDRDGDGVEDASDKCPDVGPGPRGHDGCPLARIQGNKILILDQVHFATDQDIILSESFPVLEEVADILLTHPEIQRVLVEGHTDARATDAYNFDLSRRRAASVKEFLLDSGIAVERLCSAGFGRSKPIASNDSEGGMALNRRVEFTIMPPVKGVLPPCPEDPSLKFAPPAPTKAPAKK